MPSVPCIHRMAFGSMGTDVRNEAATYFETAHWVVDFVLLIAALMLFAK